MIHPLTHYDRECLQGLLDDTLSEPLATEVSEHVAECDDCREQFESIADDDQWWSQACSKVQGILSNPQAYALSKVSEPDDDSFNDAFATDFAVDFLEPSDNPAMLGRLGAYDIVEVIGRGGMGVVLKGYQSELNRYVAVKVLAPHLAQSAAARKRFAREAEATAAIVHPHVMAIHAVAANAKLPYLVMPLVQCESLQHRLDRQGSLPLTEILRIGLQAASGLAAAHAQGLVHRDVKPGNILLETSVDRVYLTDFGLARAVDDASLTRTGTIAGTPQFMSPEQAAGDAVDFRSDLFSLGGVLFAMCTGKPPFHAETTFGLLRRIRETAPRSIRENNPEIPEWLERIVLRLLEKEPANRFSSAAEVAQLLEGCLAHVQQPTAVELPVGWDSIPTRLQFATRWLKPRRLVSAVLISAATIAAAFMLLAPQEPAAPAVANKNNKAALRFSAEVVTATQEKETIQVDGLQLSKEGLVVLPLLAKTLQADKPIAFISDPKATVRIVGTDNDRGLTLVLVGGSELPRAEVFRCRSELPTVDQKLTLVTSDGDVSVIVATINENMPDPLDGDDGFVVTTEKLWIGAPLLASERELQGIVVGNPEKALAEGIGNLSVPAIHIQRLLDAYRRTRE